jgi:tRNA nucleotidyltransferase (CCA-adding enzyme)
LTRRDLPESLDLISARTEFYDYPTALPTVERSSIKLDLHRRDFTINTMALRLDGRHYGDLYDYWGGLRDIRRGLVRVLHSLSFVDDPTRMMRAVRFEQRLASN